MQILFLKQILKLKHHITSLNKLKNSALMLLLNAKTDSLIYSISELQNIWYFPSPVFR